VPNQAPFRFIKRWRRYEQRGDWQPIPGKTRGVYVLYERIGESDRYRVLYIGASGLGKDGGGGIKGRPRSHNRRKKKWTHYSIFEVHDNITSDEIRS